MYQGKQRIQDPQRWLNEVLGPGFERRETFHIEDYRACR